MVRIVIFQRGCFRKLFWLIGNRGCLYSDAATATFFVAHWQVYKYAADSEITAPWSKSRYSDPEGSYQQNTVVMPTYNTAIIFVLDITLGWFLEFRNIDLRAILASNF